MKYLIDTSVVIDHFKGKPPVVSFLQKARQTGFAVSVISLGEILEGLVGQPMEVKRRKDLEDFIVVATVLDVNRETSEIFADIRSNLRKKGELINNFDILIAATALENNLTLATEDNDFERIAGLRLKFIG